MAAGRFEVFRLAAGGFGDVEDCELHGKAHTGEYCQGNCPSFDLK